MRTGIREVVFLVIVASLLTVPMLLGLAVYIGLPTPSWLGVGEKDSILEGRKKAVVPEATVQGFVEGATQSQTEQYLSDVVPMRDVVLQMNAKLQRSIIQLANVPRGYKCVPTFFGSDRVVNVGSAVLAPLPQKNTQDQQEKLRAIGEGIAAATARHPDKRFVVYIVDHARNSSATEASALSSNCLSTQMSCDIIKQQVGDQSNVHVVTRAYTRTDEYYHDFFRTDHHWNILGATEGYNGIAEALGLKSFDPYPLRTVGNCGFSGSNATAGLYPLDETAFDTTYEFEELTIIGQDGTMTNASDHSDYYDKSTPIQRRYFYDNWYGQLGSCSMINGPGEGKAVLISDSYGFALKRLLALNYKTLYTDSDFHGDAKHTGQTFESRLEREDISDVILVACVANYVGLQSKNPGYFLS